MACHLLRRILFVTWLVTVFLIPHLALTRAQSYYYCWDGNFPEGTSWQCWGWYNDSCPPDWPYYFEFCQYEYCLNCAQESTYDGFYCTYWPMLCTFTVCGGCWE